MCLQTSFLWPSSVTLFPWHISNPIPSFCYIPNLGFFQPCPAIHLAFLFGLSLAYLVISPSVSNLSHQINLLFMLHLQSLNENTTLALKLAQNRDLNRGRKEVDGGKGERNNSTVARFGLMSGLLDTLVPLCCDKHAQLLICASRCSYL